MSIKKAVRRVISKKKSPAERFITEDSDKVSKKEKKDLNKAFEKEGLDGNGRFKKIDHAISKLSSILAEEGLEFDEVMSSDKFKADSGRETFNIARKTRDSFSPEKIKNSMVVFSWHLMSSKPHKDSDIVKDNLYEILAYMS